MPGANLGHIEIESLNNSQLDKLATYMSSALSREPVAAAAAAAVMCSVLWPTNMQIQFTLRVGKQQHYKEM